jgi:isopentenyl phosphate kinase
MPPSQKLSAVAPIQVFRDVEPCPILSDAGKGGVLETERVFVKLGGSLITDKTRPETPRHDVIARLAAELRQAFKARPDLSLLLGHGSGSFGHWQASRYGTRSGVRGRDGWIGFAQVAASAARLNRIVTDMLLDAGLPVLGIRPSASALCRDGVLVRLETAPIRRALEQGLIPLVHGDVALDEVRGGTIVSTEELMVYLTGEFRPGRILLLGETAGVLSGDANSSGREGSIIPYITPHNIEIVASSLGGSRGPDVTGGMVSKVHQMLDLVQKSAGLQVHILSGLEPGLLTRVLLDADVAVGTRIRRPPA